MDGNCCQEQLITELLSSHVLIITQKGSQNDDVIDPELCPSKGEGVWVPFAMMNRCIDDDCSHGPEF